MADRRRWTHAETKKLVELIAEDFNFLFDAVNPAKTRQMVDDKWADITNKVNALGSGSVKLTVKQVDTKWKDIKSTSKLAKVKFDKEKNRTGGGTNSIKEPTELQYKVISMIGPSATSGIVGAENCDSSRTNALPVAVLPTISQSISNNGSSGPAEAPTAPMIPGKPAIS